MFKIGYRTVKTAVGTALSIWLAQILGFDNFVSAGILTILCIQVTQKRSLISAWERFLACIIGMAFAFAFFEGIAYHPLVIGLLLILFIPTLVFIKAKKGVVTSSVIILHFYIQEKMTTAFILNELGIIGIGIGVALIMNLYMPSMEMELQRRQTKVEQNFKRIFDEIALYLRDGDHLWDGREIMETNEMIQSAKTLAFRDVENHFTRNEDTYYHYFKMREKQMDVVEQMLWIVSSLSIPHDHAERIAELIEEISDSVHPGNTAQYFLDKLESLRGDFREMELPATRQEFEVRASLFHFLNELEKYLILKRYFKKSDL
ncbi:aromatic acid exporter family protein [Bacillus tianshenii]|nr:aromatic acid exporter family protein [Bacillus tianshenii]